MKRQIRHIVTLAYLSVCNRDLARLYARVTGQAVFCRHFVVIQVFILTSLQSDYNSNKVYVLEHE